MNRSDFLSKKISACGLLVALAMIFSYIETLIPINAGLPGMKLGIANLVVVAALYLFGPPEALLISLVRILLVGFLFGSGMSILYSHGAFKAYPKIFHRRGEPLWRSHAQRRATACRGRRR